MKGARDEGRGSSLEEGANGRRAARGNTGRRQERTPETPEGKKVQGRRSAAENQMRR